MPAAKTSVLIPAYNEEGKIYETVCTALSIPSVVEVVVIDDASKDNTAGRAKQAGAKVISLEKNLGKGGALNRGAHAVAGDVILLLDGDLGNSAIDAQLLLPPVFSDRADMVVAHFPPPRTKGGFGLVKGLARTGIKHYTGQEMQSPLSGQRAMRREVLTAILPFPSGYGAEVGITLKAAEQGFRIMEVPVQMTHSETGRDLKGFRHRGKQFADVALVLAAHALGRLKAGRQRKKQG